MESRKITVITNDAELGAMIQLYLGERGYSVSANYPWSEFSEGIYSGVLIVDTRSEWALSASKAYSTQCRLLLSSEASTAGGTRSLVLPVKARELREAIEACLAQESLESPTHLAPAGGGGPRSSLALGRRSVAPALVDCCADRFTGSLVVVGAQVRTLCMKDGLVVCARGGLSGEELGPVMVQMGLIRVGDLASRDTSDETLADTLLASDNISVEDYLRALDRQVSVRTIAALHEISPSVSRDDSAAPVGELNERRPAPWPEMLVEAARLRSTPNEIARMLACFDCSGRLMATQRGLAVASDLEDNKVTSPVWRHVTEGDAEVASLLSTGDPQILYVLAALFDAAVMGFEHKVGG